LLNNDAKTIRGYSRLLRIRESLTKQIGKCEKESDRDLICSRLVSLNLSVGVE